MTIFLGYSLLLRLVLHVFSFVSGTKYIDARCSGISPAFNKGWHYEYKKKAFRLASESRNDKMNCQLMLTYDTPAYMFDVYKNQLSRKTRSRIWRVQKRFPQYDIPIWSVWTNMILPSIVAETEVKQYTPSDGAVYNKWSGLYTGVAPWDRKCGPKHQKISVS